MEVCDRVMSVKLGLVGKTNPWQNTTEDTSKVKQLSVDELEGTAAVLLVPGAPHRAVEQSHRILAEESVTGRFPQDDPLLQDKTQFDEINM